MAKAVREDFGWLGTQTHAAIRETVETELEHRHSVATFEQVVAYGTGVFMGPYAWGLQKARKEMLERQTAKMIEALEEHGEFARYVTNTVRKGLVTGEVVEVEALRNVCFLPTMAQKNRREFINDLGYYLENIDKNGGSYHKYWVLTFGERENLPAFGDMHGAITEANRRMQVWREMAAREFDIDVHMTALEWTVNEERQYHLHANILAKTPYMKDAKLEFARFAARTEEIIGAKFLASGKIRNIRELVKYPFKPADLDGASSAELFWLFKSTFRRRIVRFHGNLAKFRRERKEGGYRVFRLRNKFRLREVASIMPHENGYTEVDLERIEQQEQLRAYCDEHMIEPPERGEDGKNILLAKVAPNFEHTLWAEPSVLIMNYDPNPEEHDKKAHRRLETLEQWAGEAREAWDAAGAPDPQVALTMAQAAALGPKNADNIRALWAKAGPHAVELNALDEEPGQYVVHNGTLSPVKETMFKEEVIEDRDEDPPKNEDDPGKVIEFPAKRFDFKRTTEVADKVAHEAWLAENGGVDNPEFWEIDDVPF